MENAETSKGKLQGFISKIEDWHRMMNFLEVRLWEFELFWDTIVIFYHADFLWNFLKLNWPQ